MCAAETTGNRRPEARPPAMRRHDLVRRANVELLFATVADHAPVSRAELSALTGLSKPTVLRLVSDLEAEGLIRRVPRDLATVVTGAGRIPNLYEPDPTAAFVVGVDLGGTKLSAALADLSGAVLTETVVTTVDAAGAPLVLRVIDLIRSLADQRAVPWARIAAVAIGTPGVENPDGSIRLAENIPELADSRIAQRVEEALSVPVRIENDVNLAALGEQAAGAARGCRTFALLSLGTGIGAGLVIDGQLARGYRGAAGEIAYLPVGGDPASSSSRRRGALEVAAAGSSLTARLAHELLADRPATALTPVSSAREIYQAATHGDPVALRVIDHQAEFVARAILSMACVIDPELVVLGGGIGSNPLLLGPVRAALDQIAPWPIEVATAQLGSSAGLIGAIHHARQAVPRLETAVVNRGRSPGRDQETDR